MNRRREVKEQPRDWNQLNEAEKKMEDDGRRKKTPYWLTTRVVCWWWSVFKWHSFLLKNEIQVSSPFSSLLKYLWKWWTTGRRVWKKKMNMKDRHKSTVLYYRQDWYQCDDHPIHAFISLYFACHSLCIPNHDSLYIWSFFWLPLNISCNYVIIHE